MTYDALIMDFYGTAVHKDKLDNALKATGVEQNDQFYQAGGEQLLNKLEEGDSEIEETVRNLFAPGAKELYDAAQAKGIETRVYSNGNGQFIEKAFETAGMPNVTFVDPNVMGSKKEATSYQTLRHEAGYDRMGFITDSKAEVRAALDSGVDHVRLVDGDNPNLYEARDIVDALGG